jgi:putative peptidoglycan lipid II flippase
VKVLAPAFYALGRPRVPLAASVLAVVTNLTVILLGHAALGYRAIALGTALGSILNAFLLVAMFERRVGGLRGHGLLRPVLRMLLAAAVMGGAALAVARGLESLVGSAGLAAQLVTGLVPVAAGIAVYLALTQLLRVGEAGVLRSLLLRRLPGRT